MAHGYSFEDVIESKLDARDARFDKKIDDLQNLMKSCMDGFNTYRSQNRNQNGNGDLNYHDHRDQGRMNGFYQGGHRNQSRGRGVNPNRGNGNTNNFRGTNKSRGRGFTGNGNGNGNARKQFPVRNKSSENKSSNQEKKKKPAYTNPLLPKDSRVSKIWDEKEVEIFKGNFGTNAEQQYFI